MQHKKNARSHLPGKIAINQENQFSNESIENNSSYFFNARANKLLNKVAEPCSILLIYN